MRRRGAADRGGSIEAATFAHQPGQDGFRVLFAGPAAGAGPAARTVLERLAVRGLPVTTAGSWAGAWSAIRTPAAPVGVAMLSWELFGSGAELTAALDDVSQLSTPPPVVVVSESGAEQALPPGAAVRTAGWFWLRADSPHFVADQVEWLIRTYALRAQVLGALAARADPGADAGAGAAGLRAGS